MYQLVDGFPGVLRLTDNSLVPSDTRNRDWREYLAWILLGNNPLPYVAPTINKIRETYKSDLDSSATRLRLMYKSPDKDSTYVMKSLQVDSFITANYPADLTAYGYIDAELSRLGLSNTLANRQAAALSITSIRDQWLLLDATIEKIILTGKAVIDTKNTKQEIEVVYNSTLSSLSLLEPGT